MSDLKVAISHNRRETDWSEIDKSNFYSLSLSLSFIIFILLSFSYSFSFSFSRQFWMWHEVKQLLKYFFPQILQIVFALLNGITRAQTHKQRNRQIDKQTKISANQIDKLLDRQMTRNGQKAFKSSERYPSLLELSNYKNKFLTFKDDEGGQSL